MPDSTTLHVPDLPDGVDVLSAALAYAEAGWYVLSVRRGSKHPGSVVGKSWQSKSSRDAERITAWFAGTDHGIALHCGRSGAVALDVDHPDRLPDLVRPHLEAGPFQATRPSIEPGRGHYMFAMPAGRTIGNSGGRLGGSWGEIRGLNGVIIVAPNPDGRRWVRAGVLPVLPDEIAAELDDASPAADAATDTAVRKFIDAHSSGTKPEALQPLVTALRKKFFAGESRHLSAVSVLAGAMKEAAAGLYPAGEAIDTIRPMFIEAVGKPPVSAKQDPPRQGPIADAEFAGILAWAVGQALAADPDAVRERVDKKTEKKNKSAATELVELALAEYALGTTDTDEAFGVRGDRPHLAMMLRAGKTGLRGELARRYFAEHKTAVSQQALSDALATLEGFAAQQEPRPVHLRVTQAGAGVVYIDTADGEGHVIEISGGTWKMCADAPGALFRRTKLTAAMPKPVVDGPITKLWEFVPAGEADQPLLLAWLVHALIQPDVPHTILLLKAEQGSAKSTVTKFLVSLIDPLSAPLRKAPRDAEGWVTAANASWVVALENISGVIPVWLSDCLCRASTGDGDVRRQLYTDADVSVFAFRRVVVINGIDVTVTQGDLADRLLRVGLPRIGEDDRKPEAEVEADWQRVRPAIFGALLELAARVHHRMRSIDVGKLPRMADYATVLAAVDEILGTAGLEHYREQCRRLAADTLDAPFIDQLVTRRYDCTDQTSAEILAAIERRMRRDDEDWRAPKGWPDRAREVTNQLTRHAPAMRAQGWTVEHDGGHNEHNALRWDITPPPPPEKACNPDSSDSSDSPNGDNRSSGLWEGDESDTSQDESDESDDESETGPNSSDSFDSPDGVPLTSENEETSQTSQEYTVKGVRCRNCGDPIPDRMPLAQASGYCTKGRCIQAANIAGGHR